MWTIAATWCMALEGARKGARILEEKGDGADALEALIADVENDPCFTSVGYGGLPDIEGRLRLDAGFMDGTKMAAGCVMALEGYAEPFRIARSLSVFGTDNVLCAEGAQRYAEAHGFAKKDMRTGSSQQKWKESLERETQNAYRGHDTVGAIALDEAGNIYAGTSTSGLFLKKPFRVGDSPLVGSGFYADSETGAAVATGLGEDLMKGCISYETVRLMKEGLSPQEACSRAVDDLAGRLKRAGREPGDLSVVAVSADGRTGASSNIREFSFVYADQDYKPAVYLVNRSGERSICEPAPDEWIRAYMVRHNKR